MPAEFVQDIVIFVNRARLLRLYSILHLLANFVQDIIIFVNTHDCYILEAHPEAEWDALVTHENDLHHFTVSYLCTLCMYLGLTSVL